MRVAGAILYDSDLIALANRVANNSLDLRIFPLDVWLANWDIAPLLTHHSNDSIHAHRTSGGTSDRSVCPGDASDRIY